MLFWKFILIRISLLVSSAFTWYPTGCSLQFQVSEVSFLLAGVSFLLGMPTACNKDFKIFPIRVDNWNICNGLSPVVYILLSGPLFRKGLVKSRNSFPRIEADLKFSFQFSLDRSGNFWAIGSQYAWPNKKESGQ